MIPPASAPTAIHITLPLAKKLIARPMIIPIKIKTVDALLFAFEETVS